jgi:S-formylglutathione hydrolase FrmB
MSHGTVAKEINKGVFMALLQCNFCSSVLGQNTNMIVLLPERRHVPRKREDKKYPVLYALHGHGQDHTNWQRDGYLEHLLKEEDVIVVMPHGGRSFYTNAKYGHEYFSFLTEELPIIIANYFPASTKRENTFIAGISMGGYGAMKARFCGPIYIRLSPHYPEDLILIALQKTHPRECLAAVTCIKT